MLIFISLQSAIFWGQYSGCESYNDNRSVNCQNKPAMKSICTFSVLMFISYITQLVAMIAFKQELLGNVILGTKRSSDDQFHSIPLPSLPNPFVSSQNSNKAIQSNYGYLPLENLLEAIKPKQPTDSPSLHSQHSHSSEELLEYSYDLEEDDHTTISSVSTINSSNLSSSLPIKQ